MLLNLQRKESNAVVGHKIQRVSLGVLDVITALVLGEWTLYTEIMYEASQRPTPPLVYAMALSVLVLIAAAAVVYFKPRMGIYISLFVCALAAPACVISITSSNWQHISRPGGVSEVLAVGLIFVTVVFSLIELRFLARKMP